MNGKQQCHEVFLSACRTIFSMMPLSYQIITPSPATNEPVYLWNVQVFLGIQQVFHCHCANLLKMSGYHQIARSIPSQLL